MLRKAALTGTVTLFTDSMSCVFNQHTLETALLSASQEIEMGSDNPAAMQSVIQQRDLLESGLLSTCREISRVTAVSPNSPRAPA